MVATTMREVAGLPPETVEYMRSQPVWQARVDAAHTIPRELRAVKAYGFDPERFGDLGVATLVLSGGESPAALRKAAEAVDEALPDSRSPGENSSGRSAPTGIFVYGPRGVPHGFEVEGEAPARMLLQNYPAGFEGFPAEVGEPAEELVLPPAEPPDMERLMAIAAKYGIEILGPLPGR